MGTSVDCLSEIVTLPDPRSERDLVCGFLDHPVLEVGQRKKAREMATALVTDVREKGKAGPVERLMARYDLTTEEGRALMALAEALLRVPDERTRDALIRDKVVGQHWFAHDADALVKAAGIALDAAGYVIKGDHGSILRAAAHRLGMPVIRSSILAGLRVFGQQFVMAETIEDAVAKSQETPEIMYSFDMLGEGARTEEDARRYLASYENAIKAVARQAIATGDAKTNNGVSVKMSALHCRYRTRNWKDVRSVLLPRVLRLASLAKEGSIPLTIDAEEASRLEISLTLIKELIRSPELKGWDGLGVVVQAYGLQAGDVLDELLRITDGVDGKLAVRLVKGAYWDTEIKVAQEKGLDHFPVYSKKSHTDLGYLALASRLLDHGDRIYPQFATHNAVTLAALETMFQDRGHNEFEVQKLHGMGDAVHDAYHAKCSRHLRVYAPVGSQDDLLAYLVRRLLENAANASFLHQLNEPSTPIEELVLDPYETAEREFSSPFRTGAELFLPERRNSEGRDLDQVATLKRVMKYGMAATTLDSPPQSHDHQQAAEAFEQATGSVADWSGIGADARSRIVDGMGDKLESNAAALLGLLANEAGKTVDDGIAEVREAVDFCRYYAACSRRLPEDASPRGVVVAISPWNFPLAIFTGQVAAALAAGNAVIAKPAEQTPRIAALAVKLMHEAGVPEDVLHLLIGEGETLGAHLVECGKADMVVFTGSTETARNINRAMAASAKPAAPLLAETGGINAMIVDSTALPERVVDDVVASAFRSAGQRCSSLRVLCIQEDSHDQVLQMLIGAGELLRVGDPADPDTDIGPVIDADAKASIDAHVNQARSDGRLLWEGSSKQAKGLLRTSAIIKVDGIADVAKEVFGPVLHVASYEAGTEESVVEEINAMGYGLTLGIHSRVLSKQRMVSNKSRAGNIYVNRNQIGAVVGSQPFGGMGLSGTGPKAGGPLYLCAFTKNVAPDPEMPGSARPVVAWSRWRGKRLLCKPQGQSGRVH